MRQSIHFAGRVLGVLLTFTPILPSDGPGSPLGGIRWSGTAQAGTFIPMLGFKDDVDVVTAWNREFVVVCEEQAFSHQGRITIIDLDADTGQPLAIAWRQDIALGFKDGVDPIAAAPGAIADTPVLIPMESADGSRAALYVLLVNDAGHVTNLKLIDLGNLGFREDVDLVMAPYPHLMAFASLESEDRSVRGVLGVDLNPADVAPPGNAFGSCVLLSSDARPGCEGPAILADWLPGLVDGVDPIVYPTDTSVRLALPVQSWMGGGDLLMLDFDNSVEPPAWTMMRSVKATNSAGPRPTSFPGFEYDVDMVMIPAAQCGLPADRILVPVEGTGDAADLYMLDRDGNSVWTLSHDSGAPTLIFPGFEAGVDLVPMCGLPGGAACRVAVPVEDAAGANADLWLVDLATGALIARAEDPAINPGLTIRGWEIGVEPVRWTDSYLFLPLEGSDGTGELMVLNNSGVLQDSRVLPGGLSFQRSVDPIVAALPDPDRTLFVPLMKPNGDDADLWFLRNPPSVHAGQTSFEALNVGAQVGIFQVDVDLGLLEKIQPGEAYMMLPEEDPTGGMARLRFEEVPSVGRYLAIASNRRGALPAALTFVRASTGITSNQFDDVLGLWPGLDMASGRGSVTPGNPPNSSVTPGYDADTDPTLSRLNPTSEVIPAHEGPAAVTALHHANPFSAPGEIRYSLPHGGPVLLEIADAAGRTVRRILEETQSAGDHVVRWDGTDSAGRSVAAGVYFLQVRVPRGIQVSKMIVCR